MVAGRREREQWYGQEIRSLEINNQRTVSALYIGICSVADNEKRSRKFEDSK